MQFPVGQITRFDLHPDYTHSKKNNSLVQKRLLSTGMKLFHIRLPLASLQKSILLEDAGFRFIEVTQQPFYSNLTAWKKCYASGGIKVNSAEKKDLSVIMQIAETAFTNERFHVDPRLQNSLANRRYANWVKTAHKHPSQSLYTFQLKEDIIGFFIIEKLTQKHMYWHLTAIAPCFQEKGYGFMSWQEMMRFHQQKGFQAISTTIATGNTPVLNLYAKLGFSFTNPEMGFHWWAEDIA